MKKKETMLVLERMLEDRRNEINLTRSTQSMSRQSAAVSRLRREYAALARARVAYMQMEGRNEISS